MFEIALYIGIFSYFIMGMGIMGAISGVTVSVVTLSFSSLIGFFVFGQYVKSSYRIPRFNLNLFEIACVLLIIIQVALNLLGALGPELSFDALWYHLTLPKIYLLNGEISYIPGGLLYYSAMPQLGEMLYIAAISLGGEIFAKLTHLLFGLLTLIVILITGKKILPRQYVLLSVVIFYSNLVVAWQSTTAYIDLIRTFFETLSFYLLFIYLTEKKNDNLFKSGVSLGFAMSTKFLAFSSIITSVIILIINRVGYLKITIYLLIAVAVASPWFIYSFLNTGNPIYPLFSGVLPPSSRPLFDFDSFIHSPDPINPIYLIIFPLLIIGYKKFDKKLRILLLYSVVSFVIWLFLPYSGGGRYIMPYLPVFSILAAYIISVQTELIKRVLIGLVILIAIVTIFYRAGATLRYVPVILGNMSSQEFLTRNLNYSFGDFYDTDRYLERNIKKTDKVLIYGIHNLYYVNFPYVHSTWVSNGDGFNYILTQKTNIPERFTDWKIIYENKVTEVKLYNNKGQTWEY